jgi:hypothetical protein
MTDAVNRPGADLERDVTQASDALRQTLDAVGLCVWLLDFPTGQAPSPAPKLREFVPYAPAQAWGLVTVALPDCRARLRSCP